MIDFKKIEIQQKQVAYALATMAIAATALLGLGDLFLSRHELYLVLSGIAIGAIATVTSLFVPS